MSNKDLVTLKEIAESLGLSPSTVSAYRARGRMPAPDLQYGRTPLWKVSTVRAWRSDFQAVPR